MSLFRRAHLTAASIGVGTLFACSAFASATVTLSPGDDIQKIVNANPTGTKFVLQAGMYRGQSITAKSNDSFTGQGVVKFVGSTALNFESTTGGLWVADATPLNTQHGTCQAAHPLCAYAQDVYIDNVVLSVKTTRTKLAAGSWYFDRQAKKVYIATNPSKHAVEIGELPYAFTGAATNVSISNITVERYANLAQFGAIGGTTTGSGWIVSNVEVINNHGTGVKLGSGSQLLNSVVTGNGELGVNLSGVNSQVINNEISYNNYAGYALGWEGGGSKFSGTTNLLVKGNYVHDNLGPGLWTDTENVGTVEENNTVTNNLSSGIQHELSYGISIHNNTLSGNGKSVASWLWNGQISIQNSSNADVYSNTITVPSANANGIAIINQNRGSGSKGVYVAANNKVHGNTITYLSFSGATGIVDDTGSHNVRGNKFSGNHYVLDEGSSADKHWCWFGTMSWPDFLHEGGETNGTVSVK